MTTALSATKPWLIQFFRAPSLGVLSTKTSRTASHSISVSTTRPELTPANFSVNAKHPSWPRDCISSKMDSWSSPAQPRMVPANRLYWAHIPEPAHERRGKQDDGSTAKSDREGKYSPERGPANQTRAGTANRHTATCNVIPHQHIHTGTSTSTCQPSSPSWTKHGNRHTVPT